MLSRFSRYTDFTSTSTATGLGTPTSDLDVAVVTATAKASCSFWMEDVAHQGKAAFNGGASYRVFRNVKDYGAKGEYMCRPRALVKLTRLQVMESWTTRQPLTQPSAAATVLDLSLIHI